MIRSTSSSGRRLTRRPARSHSFPSICVVDAETASYRELGESAKARGANLATVTNARDAMRFSLSERVDLWVINTRLPDRSGTELCNMLRQRNPKAAIYLVADDPSPEHERAARQAQPTLFGCKGEHEGWLQHWLDGRRQ